MSAVEEVSHQDGVNQVSHVVVRFAGDSGDGMQLTGSNFTEATAIYGTISLLSQIFPRKFVRQLAQPLGYPLSRFILALKMSPPPVMT